jgi:hypothetical protein
MAVCIFLFGARPASCSIRGAGRAFAQPKTDAPEEVARDETDESCKKRLRDILLGNLVPDVLFIVLPT